MSDKPKNQLVSPSGDPLKSDNDSNTERSKQRRHEDAEYIPVIIKRTDEAKIHPDDILERAISEGLEQLKRPALSLFLSASAAGLILGFSAMAVAVVYTAIGNDMHPLLQRIATALVYPLGFIVCIMSGTQLFTEHTATAVYPVLDRRATIPSLLRAWLVVILGNLSGALVIAWMMTSASDVVNASPGLIKIGHHLTDPKFASLMVSSILAGWLMAQGGWLVLATNPAISQIVCIYLVTFAIGIGGFHHSIAGSAEIFMAMMVSSEFSLGAAASFIGTALLGNLIGGSIFVATLNYAHIRKTQNI